MVLGCPSYRLHGNIDSAPRSKLIDAVLSADAGQLTSQLSEADEGEIIFGV